MSGLLSGVLPAIYSAGDSAKRRLRGLLSDPVGEIQQTMGKARDDLNSVGELQRQAFADPKQPLKVTNPQAFGLLADKYLSSVMNFAPVGMTGKVADAIYPRQEALETARINGVKMLGLPENNTPMDRAKALGFADADVYHGTARDFPRFDLSKAGTGSTVTKTEKAVFSSTKPSVANEFVAGPYYNNQGQVARHYEEGANIIPLKIRLQDPEVWEMAGRGYEAPFVQQALKEARIAKADSVLFKNMRDPGLTTLGRGDPSTVVATLKPQTLRSRFAAFDPARVNDNDLLGRASLPMLGLLGAGSAGAAYLLRDKEQK